MLRIHDHHINNNGFIDKKYVRYKKVLAKKDRAEAREIH